MRSGNGPGASGRCGKRWSGTSIETVSRCGIPARALTRAPPRAGESREREVAQPRGKLVARGAEEALRPAPRAARIFLRSSAPSMARMMSASVISLAGLPRTKPPVRPRFERRSPARASFWRTFPRNGAGSPHARARTRTSRPGASGPRGSKCGSAFRATSAARERSIGLFACDEGVLLGSEGDDGEPSADEERRAGEDLRRLHFGKSHRSLQRFAGLHVDDRPFRIGRVWARRGGDGSRRRRP